VRYVDLCPTSAAARSDLTPPAATCTDAGGHRVVAATLARALRAQ
jgi:hypothetical protein